MFILCILGALSFYGFIYLLLSQYAQGILLTTITTFDGWPPVYLRLSSDAAVVSLKWLVAAVVVYCVLDFLVLQGYQTCRLRPSKLR